MDENIKDSIKGFLGALAFWVVIGAFAAAVVHYHTERQRLCPGYSDYQACIAMGE